MSKFVELVLARGLLFELPAWTFANKGDYIRTAGRIGFFEVEKSLTIQKDSDEYDFIKSVCPPEKLLIGERVRLFRERELKYEEADPPAPEEEQKEEATGVRLYTKYEEQEDGTKIPVGYAYGEPWVAQALSMDDLRFETPEGAVAWWENEGRWQKK